MLLTVFSFWNNKLFLIIINLGNFQLVKAENETDGSCVVLIVNLFA